MARFVLALIFSLPLLFFASPNALSQGGEISESMIQGVNVDTSSSKTSLEILESIKKQRMELMKREEDIREKEKRLKEVKSTVDKRITELQELRTKLENLLDQLKEKDKERFKHLVKVYEAMRPEEAGPLISTMDDKIAIRIFSEMNNKKAAKILPFIEPEKATKISEALIKKK